MSTFQLDNNNANYQIRGFKPGAIQINEQIYHRSVIVMPTLLIENWPPQTFQELTLESFAPILKHPIEILLLGTGSSLVFLPLEMQAQLNNQGIGVEIMNTSAACRTFNALSAENRNVAAALLLK